MLFTRTKLQILTPEQVLVLQPAVCRLWLTDCRNPLVVHALALRVGDACDTMCSLYLVYWYKSTVTDAAGARHAACCTVLHTEREDEGAGVASRGRLHLESC